MSDRAQRMTELLKRTNAHTLLPPAAGESNTALPGIAMGEAPENWSTSDPLVGNSAEIDMLSNLSWRTRPSWHWWIALVCGWLPAMLAVPMSIYLGWGDLALARTDGYGALKWSLITLFGGLYAAVWTHALFRRKPS